MSPEEAEMLLEQRAKGSRRMRSHQVTLGRCRCCGTALPASVVAEIDQGEVRCPAADRIAEAFAAAVDDLLTALEAIAGGESS